MYRGGGPTQPGPPPRTTPGWEGLETMSKDIKALLAGAKLPEETVPVCLRADLVAEFEQVERELEAAQRKPSTSLAGNGARPLAERLEALRAEMEESTVTFRLRAMPRKAWAEFVDRYPPRKTGEDVDERDVVLGVNIETFFPALVRRSTVEPELDDEDWAKLLGGTLEDEDGNKVEVDSALTHHQFYELANGAWQLNKKGIDIPFSFAASEILTSEPE